MQYEQRQRQITVQSISSYIELISFISCNWEIYGVLWKYGICTDALGSVECRDTSPRLCIRQELELTSELVLWIVSNLLNSLHSIF